MKGARDSIPSPATTESTAASYRLVAGLASLSSGLAESWEDRLHGLLALGADVLGLESGVLVQANNDHYWVVAATATVPWKTGDRLETGEAFPSLPHQRQEVILDLEVGRVGAPVSRGADSWGALTFHGSSRTLRERPDTVACLTLIASWLSRDLTVRQLEADLHRSKQHLGHLVHIDPLTELYNRRGASEAFENFVRRSGFEGTPLSYLICGLSGMQKVNARFGRQTGDRVVRAVARSLRTSLRPGDVAARIGRYELLGILPGASLNAARAAAQRVTAGIEALRLTTKEGEPVVPTVRIGVARVTGHEDAFEDVLHHVAPLLREAARTGEVAVANGMFNARMESG